MESVCTVTFPARFESLADICDFVTQAAQAASLDTTAVSAVQTAVDEACSNIIEHAYPENSGGQIECTCEDTTEKFIVTIKDHGTPFNPEMIPAPDIDAGLEDRPIGGLGLYFMRQLMDEVKFEFITPSGEEPGANILMLAKHKRPDDETTESDQNSSGKSGIESAFAALKRRSEQLVSVAEVSHALNSILDFEQLLDEIVRLISHRLGFPYVQIFTVHTGRRKVFYRAGNIPGNEQFRRNEFAFNLDDTAGIIPWVARNGQTLLANDVTQEPLYRLAVEFPSFFNVRSELTIPLSFGGNVLGVLDIQSEQTNAFSEDDRTLFEALGASISVAIRNAGLYHSEQWRRQVADGLREVAGLLSADADLDQVLDAILAEIERNLPCAAAAIWLLEEAEGGEQHKLALAAVHAPGGDLNLEYSRLEPGEWLEQAILSKEPITRDSASPYEPLGTFQNYPPEYSAIAAPLRIGEKTLGVMTVVHATPNRYGSEARSITASFASYAAVAIENTRLYEASHAQAWVATVLLQVAEATQSISDIPELLTTLAQITPMLVGVGACAFWLWDENNETFWPVSAHGLSSEHEIEFQLARFIPGEQECFDKIALSPTSQSGKLVVAYSDDMSLLRSDILCTKMLFPLLAHSQVLGAMLVHFTTQADDLQADQVAIIQGIAHQTATAVESIRLIRSQREEAYVSVALLQVAQAIVSMNDLGEILEAIVRITPILVGVRRVAIFLWDELHGGARGDERGNGHGDTTGHAGYRFGRGYGFTTEEQQTLAGLLIPRGQFRLLDAIHEGDSPAYAPLPSEPQTVPVAGASAAGAPDTAFLLHEWQSLTPITPARASHTFDKPLLRHKERLLLGFPLSVKNRLLGVMLAEETDPQPQVSTSVRERRLEIITGISQQAALAIQNDMLQSEVVERERLERELQLAREIQRTFLPEILPEYPGIDLDVRWRPARQVGGDFYDVIEFEDGRLGLVIADVADKGMPAALIMTLMRTLVRATAQEVVSPAAVLERVNNLLVPDARNGMFVTAVYAVLSADCRELTYANAGHNRPLIIRAGGKITAAIETLSVGSMALGIETDIRIREASTSLAPGDVLVFYTDGVTESFAPDGEMFGESSLLEVLRLADISSARTVLDAIEQAVNLFTGEEFPSDDLTLVGVKRIH